MSVDPVMMGSRFVTDVQSIISREKDPKAFGVVTVGAFTAGTVNNIIPDHADLKLTLRSHDDATRKLLVEGVERTARAVAAMAHAPEPTITQPTGTNAVHNDAALSARSAAMLKTVFGKDVQFVPASESGGTASEDYSVFIDEGVPSVFFAIGGYDPATIARYKAERKPLPVNHSPYFAPVPEPTIKRGAQTLALSAMMVLGNGAGAK
jgi:hippurate hydrolase